MKQCPHFDKDDIGIRYSTLKDKSILTRDVTTQSEEELKFRNQLLEFEKHYFDCDVCLKKVREEQEIHYGFQQLGESGLLQNERARERFNFNRWVAVAASVFFISTVALTVWVTTLFHELNRLESTRNPQTVSHLFMLKPYVPLERSPDEDITRIPAQQGPILLGIDVPEREITISRFEARIFNASKQEIWKIQDTPVDPAGKIYITIVKGFLEPGNYELQIRILNKSNGKEKNRVSFHFLIEKQK